jgi:hypothetical protein
MDRRPSTTGTSASAAAEVNGAAVPLAVTLERLGAHFQDAQHPARHDQVGRRFVSLGRGILTRAGEVSER